jgi:hypothetical protein
VADTTRATPPPIACSLSADDLRARAADTRELARHALRDRRAITGGARLTFDPAPGVHQRLSDFVVAESACCPFLTLALERIGGALILDITGPEEAAPIIAELFAAGLTARRTEHLSPPDSRGLTP